MLLHYLEKVKYSNLLHFVVSYKKRATFQPIVIYTSTDFDKFWRIKHRGFQLLIEYKYIYVTVF